MKGLMFNLLESMANTAGCSDEAWELVVEFAAAESLLEQATSARGTNRSFKASLSYAAPAEAMVRCLSQDGPPLGAERSWDVYDAAEHHDWMLREAGFPDEGGGETLFQQRSYGAGFAAEAFLEPDALMDAWGRGIERDWEEEELADEWIRQQRREKREPQKK